TGTGWPDEASDAPIGDVLILQAEDDPAITVRPRLERLGADVDRVLTVPADRTALSLDAGLPRLERVLAAIGTVRLVIIDPLTSYLGKLDYTKDTEVRRALGPLKALAERYNVAVVAVMHLNKNQQQQISYRVGGSIAFSGVARSVVLVAKDREDEGRRLF